MSKPKSAKKEKTTKTKSSPSSKVVVSTKKIKHIDIQKISWKYIIVFCSAVVVVAGLVLLASIRPTITIDKTEKINVVSTINLNSQYPELEFSSNQIIKINNKEVAINDNYKTKSDDFFEGRNTIKSRYYLNLFFFELIGSEQVAYDVKVDRIAPEIKLKTDIEDTVYFVDGPIVFDFESEAGAKFFINDEQDSVFDSSEIATTLPVQEGQNSFSFYVEDEAGNQSEKQTAVFNAVQITNWLSGDGFDVEIMHPTSWKLSATNLGGERGYKERSIVLQKNNVTLTFDLFGMLEGTDVYQVSYCSDNKDMIEDVDGKLVRIQKYDLVNHGNHDYEFVKQKNNYLYTYIDNDYSQIKPTLDQSTAWSYTDSWGTDATKGTADASKPISSYSFCVGGISSSSIYFQHSFVANSNLATWSASVKFDGEVDQDLLAEADMIVVLFEDKMGEK